jgi:protoporphyrinogen oxidase
LSYETIVIGGGPGGCATAALLAARGQDVLLLETSGMIGGRARTYEGDQFDSLDSLVEEYEGAGAMVMTKTPELDKAIRDGKLNGYAFELGEHGIAGSHLLRTGYVADAVGADIEILPNVGAFWDHEGELFEIKKGEPLPWLSDQEYQDVRAISKLMMTLTDEEVNELDDVGFGTWINGVSDSDVAKAFHGSMATMNTGPANPENISTGENLRTNRQILRAGAHITWAGIGFPVPGYGAIPEGLHKAFEEKGGTTRLNAPVEEILTENGKVIGVRVGDEKIFADRVVSTLPVPLIPRILEENDAMRVDIDRYKTFKSGAALTIYIGCAEPVVEDEGAWYTSPRIAPASEGYSGDLISGWIASSNCVTERAPEGRQLFESWCGLTTEEAMQPDLVANAMKREWENLTHFHPELVDAEEWRLVTLAQRAYPVLPSPGQVADSLVDAKPGWYDGLFMVGDSVRSWGCSIDQVMHSALLCVDAICETTDAIEIVPDYMR